MIFLASGELLPQQQLRRLPLSVVGSLFSNRTLIGSVRILTSFSLILASQTLVAVADTFVLLLVYARKPAENKTVESFGLDSMMFKLES